MSEPDASRRSDDPDRLYIDSSALVALYARENHSATARAAVSAGAELVVSYLAYAEARAALAAQRRAGRLGARAYTLAVRQFENDWPRAAPLVVDEQVALVAGDLAERLALKGADAVHLASALWFDALPGRLRVLTFDQDLAAAASAVGLALYVRSPT